MTIFIRIGAGPAIVLFLILAAALSGHSSALGGTLTAVVLCLAVVVVLAILGALGYLVYRLTHPRAADTPPLAATVLRVTPEPGQPGTAVPRYSAPALAPPAALPQHQLEELAELIRRGQRPE